jgi:hypothetical protein
MRPLFPQKADIDLVNRNVRLVPQADVARSAAAIPVALGRQGKCISIVHLMALDRHLVSGPSRRRVPGCCQPVRGRPEAPTLSLVQHQNTWRSGRPISLDRPS